MYYIQVRNVINMELIFPQTLLLLLESLTVGLMTGHLMQGELNLNLPTFSIVEIKCLHLTLTCCSISGMPHRQHMVNQHHFRITRMCMIQLMPLLLVTFHGRTSLFNLMEIDQKAKFHLGWMQTMMFGTVMLANLFTTLFQIQTLKMDLTMFHIRSMIMIILIITTI